MGICGSKLRDNKASSRVYPETFGARSTVPVMTPPPALVRAPTPPISSPVVAVPVAAAADAQIRIAGIGSVSSHSLGTPSPASASFADVVSLERGVAPVEFSLPMFPPPPTIRARRSLAPLHIRAGRRVSIQSHVSEANLSAALRLLDVRSVSSSEHDGLTHLPSPVSVSPSVVSSSYSSGFQVGEAAVITDYVFPPLPPPRRTRSI